jgi:hypothetical protein
MGTKKLIQKTATQTVLQTTIGKTICVVVSGCRSSQDEIFESLRLSVQLAMKKTPSRPAIKTKL